MTSRPAPTQESLHESALAYLAQRATSVAQMKKVLERRIATWARRAPEDDVEAGRAKARVAAEAVIARLVASGLLNDTAYAERRAESLTRAGKSRRAVAFELSRKGVAEATVRAATPTDNETEFGAAVTLMRKKRLGPYARTDEPDDKTKRRWLGAFARGGFSFAIAQRALRMTRDDADELIRQLR